MNSKQKLFRALYFGLLEIRFEAQTCGNNKIFEIANLFHNLPLKLQSGDVDYDKILNEMLENSKENVRLDSWLKSNNINS